MRQTTPTSGCYIAELFHDPSANRADGQDVDYAEWKIADDILGLYPKEVSEIIETRNLNFEASRTRCNEILCQIHDDLETRKGDDAFEKQRRVLLDWVQRAAKTLTQSVYQHLRWERGL